jgi:hypothetical protein
VVNYGILHVIGFFMARLFPVVTYIATQTHSMIRILPDGNTQADDSVKSSSPLLKQSFQLIKTLQAYHKTV